MKRFYNDKNLEELSLQYNNYIYPKPCEDIDKEWIELNRYQLCDPNYFWHKIWPEKEYSRNSLNILVAGCGSDQAAILAKCNPNHKFLGIDLSENSLNHQKKLVKNHNIKNLEFICGDFRKYQTIKKFDYIISSGVIHHLDDIETALKYFHDNLKDDGAIFLMIYGDQQSQGINNIKNVFKKLNLDQNQYSIDTIRKIINKLKVNHPAKIFSKLYADINNDAGVIDTFMHPSEKFHNIKNFMKLLDNNNLIIKNFADSRIAPISKYFIDNKEIMEKVKSMKLEDQLELAQIINWNDRKMNIICSKNNRLSNSFIYNKIDLDSAYIYKAPKITYQIFNHGIKIIDKENESNFEINYDFEVNWKEILSGKKKLFENIKYMDQKIKLNFYKNIEFLLENYVLDFSLHRIMNYENYYGK